VQRYLVDLECVACRTERLHNVTYLGSVVASVTCTICGESLRPRPEILIADYVRDFELRLVRKPGRMLRKARRHPVSFMFHYLPRGLVNKPREVLQEWEALARINTAAGRRKQQAAAPR
jgi:hypothetical protein